MSSRESPDDDDMHETVLETTTALPVLANASEELRVNFTEMRSNATVDIVTTARYRLRRALASGFLHLRKSGDRLARLSLLAKDSLMAKEPPTLVMSVMPLAAVVLSLLIWRVAFKGRKRTAFEKDDAVELKMDGNFSPIALFGCLEMTRSGLLEWLCCMPYMWADTVLRSGVFTRAKVLLVALILLVFMWAFPLLWQHLDAPLLSSVSRYIGAALTYYTLFQARRGMKEMQDDGEKDEVSSFFWTRIIGSLNLCPAGTSATCMEDACAVVLCAPCTIAQEAQFQEITELAAEEDDDGRGRGLLEW